MKSTRNFSESGQALALFTLMLAVLVSFMVLVFDVGAYMVERQDLQNVVDAAALAGAQELPDDVVAAEAMARDYAQRNGHDPDDLQISFRCTSTIQRMCAPSLNRFDTIVVNAGAQAPAYFGPVLTLFGSNSCWTEGCVASMTAAGCRGVCSGAGAQVDVVLAIDHTGSMTATDLQNAKDGALAFMRTFDDQVHRIALAVTPPVDPGNHCDTINTWSDPKVWLPVPLSSDFQASPGVLNTSSALVSTTTCLDIPQQNVELSGPHTNLGEPLKAALAELQANGRTGAKQAIVLETDGAANIMDSTAASAIGARGPCDYAFKVAQQIKNLGIELYTIAYGADDRCTRDAANSPWYNKTANELLVAMATDASHAYVEPKTGDIEAIFETVGIQLASGSRLVQ